ncbi:hypothetical protein PYCCODRAFT_946515 [Trametes coccinea BRFM310]|uniref:LsmAD domain-containing protein n=1 Tax=Trametes coccinea (strain BRFM310) TaxID=1353009 RepID=A0A1Y2IZH2_TRAC3|nr:hypothetical protein PYCCODRAFT_946515 [Trametes coccinea BRFM310]
MAATARQSKPPRKGPDPAARRTNAWGPRASPTFSPGPANARLPNGNQQQQQQQQQPAGAFPPLNGARQPDNNNPHAQVLQKISGLTGTTITISTKTNMRLEGVVSSTTGEGDTQGVTLKDVKEISNPGAPLRESFFVAATNIQDWSSGPADAKMPNGADSFKTDTDISKAQARRERELQAWQPEPEANPSGAPAPGQTTTRNTDEETFGPGASGGTWDQFAVNEKLFGITGSFPEELYTTKLDRNAPDFAEKERKAQQIANEIMGTATNNPHIAEERILNLNADGSNANEEDKYGAVVRGANAYVPPGARKANANATTPPAKTELPKVAVNAPDGSAVPQTSTTSSTPSASKVPSPAPGATAGGGAAKQPADAVPAFRNFVSTEKDRLLKKKQALMKSEMDKRLSDLVNFSKSFKLNKPIPDDLVPILAKDEEKQRLIKEKTVRDAEDQRARAIGVSSTLAAAPLARAVPPSAGIAPSASKPGAETARQMPAAKATASSGAGAAAGKATATAPSKAGDAGKKISMYIQPIPPFKGKRSSTSPGQQQPGAQNNAAAAASASANGGGKPAASPLSPTAANRLNVNASSFRPTGAAKVSPFSPGGSPNPNAAASSTSSPKGKPAEAAGGAASPQGPPNPFFGPRLPKRSPPVHIKDDFNPFKHHKVIEASQVAPTWPYSGKRYMQMFPPIQQQQQQPQQQQQSPPMAPPGPPPPMPPAPYEEDPAAQAARGYVYAYPPYAYPGQVMQPMMAGMAPPPPGYMPGPYMQPMPYPMPPPNAMYPSTPMGQMPPPQAYMPPPPPPGTYPPPPNGAGPRPSMPPTPIPSHAHAYYHHQSPQLQHAMPYPMMMPPPGPGGVPPHPYDPSGQPPPPPVPMGGVSHA